MSAGDFEGPAAERVRRLELDLADLRAENARLKGSIAQRQEEIVRLGERLAVLQKRLAPVHRAAAWPPLRRLRAMLRRPG
ncbi:hypothetical protein [Lichenibacterium dinghuense]|uniref:hypothetical protein n=1 Tax=Lichenibacterium dinghuense TaxID=2895977 RepID=UPI001F343059|nr:hypothetical protein [Lichenibacterium sp. 6Y81]